MARSKTPTHVVEFPLNASYEQHQAVQTRFGFLRQLYNAALGELFKRQNRLDNSSEYQSLRDSLRLHRHDKTLSTDIRKSLAAITKEFGVTEAAIQSFTTANKNACCFKDHLDAHTTQTIASRAFKTFADWKYKGRGKPRFKSWRRGIHSAEGKNQSCLSLVVGNADQPTVLRWKGLSLPLVLSSKDNQGYEAAALDLIGKGQWKFCRVIERTAHGKPRLYVQVLMSGRAFIKAKNAQKIKAGKGKRVGLDIGPSTIAAVSLQSALLSPLSGDILRQSKAIARLQRQQARRLRLANPQNYIAHQKRIGERTKTVFKVKRGARHWVKSKSYLDTEKHIHELHRKMAATRKQGHDMLSNELLAMGNTVLTEKLSYKAWHKLFGKSVGASAPGSLIATLKRKAENADGNVIEINAWKAKLSQYDHVLDSYTKKNLSQRTHLVGNDALAQRDLYSAFLAMCVDEKKHLVSRADAITHWPSVRHSLEDAVIQVNQAATSRAMPGSFGLGEFRSHQSRSCSH